MWKSDILVTHTDQSHGVSLKFHLSCFSHILLMQAKYLVSQKLEHWS